jgi:hypothetical protein
VATTCGYLIDRRSVRDLFEGSPTADVVLPPDSQSDTRVGKPPVGDTKASGRSSFVAMMQAANFGEGDNFADVRAVDRPWFRGVFLQCEMRSAPVIEVDNATPIVLSLEKFVIRGIHGAVGLSRCTRR